MDNQYSEEAVKRGRRGFGVVLRTEVVPALGKLADTDAGPVFGYRQNVNITFLTAKERAVLDKAFSHIAAVERTLAKMAEKLEAQ